MVDIQLWYLAAWLSFACIDVKENLAKNFLTHEIMHHLSWSMNCLHETLMWLQSHFHAECQSTVCTCWVNEVHSVNEVHGIITLCLIKDTNENHDHDQMWLWELYNHVCIVYIVMAHHYCLHMSYCIMIVFIIP